jgi:exonuclease VII small subunit
MSNYDPRVIAQVLDDLQDQLDRWSSIASEMLTAATDGQRQTEETVGRSLHKAAVIWDRAKGDEEKVLEVVSSVMVVVEKCNTAKNIANQTILEARKVLENAKTTLAIWQAEFEKALAWLTQAEARLTKAIREYERAQRALQSAEWDLSSAEARYRDCISDKERSNCYSESAAVSSAQAAVARARQWVRVAEQEVAIAKEEVGQAKARVACCQKAVALATQAVSLSKEGESNAIQAINSAERSLEFAKAAERLVLEVQGKVFAEIDNAESAMAETHAAQSLTDEAALHLRAADTAENTAQLYCITVRKELENRVQLLYELNGQSQLASAVGVGLMGLAQHSSSMSTSITSAERQAILNKWLDVGINIEEMERLKLPVSDLRAETLQEDRDWVYQILESEQFREATRGLWTDEASQLGSNLLETLANWATSLAGVGADTSKVIQYWKNKQ